MATISTHNRSSVSRGHNLRQENIVSKESHIDPDGVHETWIDEAPREAYERIFGDAVREYNGKQTRADRQIKDYYNHVRDDAKKHCVYEMIVGVYPADGEHITGIQEKVILKQFVNNWNKRNPNLEIIGAYFHADEQGKAPHVHIDYIPVAHGYKKGMKTQNGMVKALGEMGFKGQGKVTAQILWEKRENEYLEGLCNSFGIPVEHPDAGKGVKHLHTQTYKAQRDLAKTQEELEEKKAEGIQQNVEIYKSQQKIKLNERKLSKIAGDINDRNEELKEINDSLENRKNFLDLQNRRIERKNETIKDLDTQINGLNEQISSIREELDSLPDPEQYRTKAINAKMELFSVENDLNIEREKLKALKGKIERCEGNLESMQQENRSLEEKNKLLKDGWVDEFGNEQPGINQLLEQKSDIELQILDKRETLRALSGNVKDTIRDIFLDCVKKIRGGVYVAKMQDYGPQTNDRVSRGMDGIERTGHKRADLELPGDIAIAVKENLTEEIDNAEKEISESASDYISRRRRR